MSKAPVATEVHEPLDVHLHFAPQVALDLVVGVEKMGIFLMSLSVSASVVLVGGIPAPSQMRRAEAFPMPYKYGSA